MRNAFSVIWRFLLGWLVVFLVLCVISIIKHWQALVNALKGDASVLLEGGFVIFLTLFAIIYLLRSITRW